MGKVRKVGKWKKLRNWIEALKNGKIGEMSKWKSDKSKGKEEITEERQLQGAAWEIYVSPFILFSDLHIGSTYRSVIFSHISLHLLQGKNREILVVERMIKEESARVGVNVAEEWKIDLNIYL